MKQRFNKLLSGFLCIALIASAVVGALSASVLPAKAADPVTGYFDDLMEQARNYCPANSLTQFDNVVQQIHDNFDSWLVVIIYRPTDQSWYVASYIQDTSKDLNFWGWRNTYYYYFWPTYTNTSGHDFYSRYGFKIKGNNIWFEPYGTGLGNTTFEADAFWQNSWSWSAPTPDDINESSRSCYTNIDLHAYNGSTEPVFLYANLENGSYTPPIIDFSYFKFNLGDRWYLTTYDQSLVLNMERGDDTFWIWVLRLLPNDGSEELDPRVLSFSKMEFLPYAENFITQNVTNVSSRGILAYDITDLISSGEYYSVFESFFSIATDASPDPTFQPVAFSDTSVMLFLEPDQENQSINESWTTINNYVINYPSVTIAPEQLADQLFGDTAYTGFMGDIRIPYSLGLKFGLFGQDVNLCDAYFHYWLYQSGLGADENSILNFDLFNACVIAAPQVNRNVYVAYWDTNDPQVIDYTYVGLMDTQDLLDTFDLLLVAPAGSAWLKEVDGSFPTFTGSSAAYTNLNQEFSSYPRGVEGVYPVYIIVSHKAITKSQLFVFCDGFEKLYNLATQYCNKRDLWDSSFFEWSMSVFWALQSIDGRLFRIETEIASWNMKESLQNVVRSLEQIANNTSEEDVSPWYLALFNWIKSFEPSNNDFVEWVENYDDFVDDLPDPGGATIIPFPTAAPTALPTVAVAGG